jgi:hypothetical protein
MTTTAEYLRHVERTYGVKPAEYRAMYYAQGGRCFICRKASGRSRRLGVDHDHLTGEVRVLVCTGSINAMTCNRLIAIYGREMLVRAAAVLSDPPPARALLRAMRADGFDPAATRLPTLVPSIQPFLLREVRGVPS